MSTPIPSKALQTLKALRKSVADTLEKKRRLGHYFVVWQDGQPVFIGDDAPSNLKSPDYEAFQTILSTVPAVHPVEGDEL